ncbi:AraC family transcriptional regulator [Leptospira perolatii]|nr:helix-turn-helix domain-containing protein [Leptospira perolatii]
MHTFLAFGAGLAFLLCLANWRRDKIAAFLFFAVSIVQFHIFLELSGELPNATWLMDLHIPAIFLIGPLAYLYFQNLSGNKIDVLPWIHFIPSILSVLIMLPFYLKSHAAKVEFLEQPQSGDIYMWMIPTLLGSGTVLNFFYPSQLLLKLRRWRGFTPHDKRIVFTPFFTLYATTLVLLLLFVVAQIFFMQLFSIAACGVTTLLCAVFLIHSANADLGISLRRQVSAARYAESRISGIDVDSVVQRMEELMSEERVYLDENLSLGNLAKKLKINSHQLSEILNSRMRKNFRNYVADFRLREAERLLKEESERSVLSIIYSSGFNSKSAFHKLFQEKYGCNPTEFRSQSKPTRIS